MRSVLIIFILFLTACVSERVHKREVEGVKWAVVLGRVVQDMDSVAYFEENYKSGKVVTIYHLKGGNLYINGNLTKY